MTIDQAGALAVPLLVIAFSRNRVAVSVYYLLAYQALGVQGIGIATLYVVVFTPVMFLLDLVGRGSFRGSF